MNLTTCRIRFLFFSLFIIMQACNDGESNTEENGKTETLKDSSQAGGTEDLPVDSTEMQAEQKKIVDTIFNLTEVRELQNYIDKQTAGKRRLQIFIDDTPTTTNNYYSVKVAEDNGSNLVTHFNFFVYPSPIKIMYFDVATDKEMTLEEWRRTK